jgi:hypothetical protein
MNDDGVLRLHVFHLSTPEEVSVVAVRGRKKEEEVQVERGVPLRRASLDEPIPICLHNARESAAEGESIIGAVKSHRFQRGHIMRAGNIPLSLPQRHPLERKKSHENVNLTIRIMLPFIILTR